MPTAEPPETAAPIFPPRDAWLPVVPALPLVLATLMFAWLIDPGQQLSFLRIDPSLYVAEPQRDYIHLGDMLAYYSLGAFHSLLCLTVVATFAIWMGRLPARRLKAALVFLAGILLVYVVFGVFYKTQANFLVLIQLGYKAICQLIAAADLPTRLVVPGQCFEVNDISRLTVLAWIPTFSGMGAVAFAGAFAYAAAGDLPRTGSRGDPAWRAAVSARVKALQRSVYLLSAVLVSSTVTITLFAHLPVGILSGDKAPGVAAAVSKYATGLSTFWGTLFSVTLIATFLVPALRLLAAAYGSAGAGSESNELQSWLREHVFQSLKRQLATVFSLLAPLLIGPLSSLLSSVTGM